MKTILLLICTILVLSNGCQLYCGKVGNTKLSSSRFLMKDAKKGVALEVTDPNGMEIKLYLNDSTQQPDANSVEAVSRGIVRAALGGAR